MSLEQPKQTDIFEFNEFVQVEDQKNVFTVYSDPEKLEAHIKELSPNDAALGRGIYRRD